jgi:hypothetical protein
MLGKKDNKIKKEMPDDQRDSTAANNAGPNNQGNMYKYPTSTCKYDQNERHASNNKKDNYQLSF